MDITVPKTVTLDSTNVADSAYSEYNSATTYAAGDKVKVSFESDGTTARQPHREYESLTSSNTGNYPPDDATNWLLLGSTNRWAMFDDYISSQTTNTNTIEITLSAEKINKIALFDLDASEVQIVVKDSTPTTLSDETFELKYDAASWSEYFFDEFEYKTAMIYDIPAMYLNLTIEITITAKNTGLDAGCGHCVIGLSKEIGLTEWDASTGIIDYSVRTTNDFGETEFTERSFGKTMDIDVFIEHDTTGNKFDIVHRRLSGIRATPVVFNANNNYGNDREALIIFGYYKDFDLIAKYDTYSHCNLNIEGLI